jgi:ABC-type sugar transport system ATPase subunit
MTDSKILILDEPTRGVDVGAKAEIYELIVEMVKKGLSVIMISCEEAEILGMCHRVLVMRDGKILGEFAHDEVDSEELVGLCLGGREVAV